MGVRELWPILEPVGQPVTLHDLQGKKVAIDLSIWIREREVIPGVDKPYLRNIFWRVLHLLRHQVTPVFVVEGAPPALKNAELERRLHGTPRKKGAPAPTYNNASPRGKNAKFEAQIQECCELLEALGVCYVHSDGEAEATCAQLNLHGVVDGCVTQDGDAFLFGAHTVYRNFTCNSQKAAGMCVYHMEDVQRRLGLTRRHLVCLALLLGCDYYTGVKAVGRKYAEDFMKEIQGHDPIHKLRELRTGAFYKRLSTLGSTTKRRHCLKCQHPGSKEVHQKQGCILCKSEGGCQTNPPDHPCACPFHADRRQLAEHAAGIKIYRHIQHETDFPPQQVVDAFLKPSYRAPDHELEWHKPSVHKLQAFNQQHLGWGADKVEARFVPLLTAWDLSHPWDTALLPLRILKIFHDHGQKMIEVEWKYEDPSLQIGRKEAVTTKEFYDVMSDVHPDLVSGYEAEQKKPPKSTKTPAKRKMLKAAAGCHTIGDMLKRKKPRIEAAAGKPNDAIPEPTNETAQTNGKHSSKQKDPNPRIEAVAARAEEVVESPKGGSQTNGHHSVSRVKPGARVSLFSRFEGLLHKDSSMETMDDDSNEQLSTVLGEIGPADTFNKTMAVDVLSPDANNDDPDVSILKTSPVPIPLQETPENTAVSFAEPSEFSTENGESDVKSPIDNTKAAAMTRCQSEESNGSIELIIDTSSESSVAMVTNSGNGAKCNSGKHKVEGRSAEGHMDVGHTDVGHMDVGHMDVGHTDVGHTDVGHVTVPEMSAMDIDDACQEEPTRGQTPSEEQPSTSLKTKAIRSSTRKADGSGDGQCPTVSNGAEGRNDEGGEAEGYTEGRNAERGISSFNIEGRGGTGRVLQIRLEKVDEGGVLGQDRGATKNADTNLNGSDQDISRIEAKDSAEINNLDDEEDKDGEHDSDNDIFVVQQSQPETSTGDQQNGTMEENELPRLRKRAGRKEPAVKPKVKTRSKKKLKDCPGQPKIMDMFSVKKQSEGTGLKMVLVRKSDL